MPDPKANPDTLDLLHGIGEIAAYIGVSRRRAAYLVECQSIPFFRIGRKIQARRHELDGALRSRHPE